MAMVLAAPLSVFFPPSIPRRVLPAGFPARSVIPRVGCSSGFIMRPPVRHAQARNGGLGPLRNLGFPLNGWRFVTTHVATGASGTSLLEGMSERAFASPPGG